MTDLENAVIGSEKKTYVKPEFEVIELDNLLIFCFAQPRQNRTNKNKITKSERLFFYLLENFV